jgi:hypothetical protein
MSQDINCSRFITLEVALVIFVRANSCRNTSPIDDPAMSGHDRSQPSHCLHH